MQSDEVNEFQGTGGVTCWSEQAKIGKRFRYSNQGSWDFWISRSYGTTLFFSAKPRH